MIGMKKISNIKMGKVTGNPATSAVVISNLNSVTVGVSVVRWHWNFIFRPLVFFLRCLPASFFVGLLLSFFVGLLLSFFLRLLLFFLRRLISPSPSLRIARCRRQRCLALSSSLLCCMCCASLCGEFGFAALFSLPLTFCFPPPFFALFSLPLTFCFPPPFFALFCFPPPFFCFWWASALKTNTSHSESSPICGFMLTAKLLEGGVHWAEHGTDGGLGFLHAATHLGVIVAVFCGVIVAVF